VPFLKEFTGFRGAIFLTEFTGFPANLIFAHFDSFEMLVARLT
jgi:hypothetical protein